MRRKASLAILITALAIFGSGCGETSKKVITSSELEKAIDISQLSTADFVYNGIAEKYDDDDPEKVDCYIAYDANVKVGIDMKDIKFDIDDEKKVIKPILPEIAVNIATLDEKEISYIPKNPDIPLKEIITLCREDAINEANDSEKLYSIAEENLKTAIEALLLPILDSKGYTLNW